MSEPANRGRRSLVASLAGMSLGASANADDGAVVSAARKTLVAYFSRSGNTRVVAGMIQRRLNAELFEILAATPYPLDYLATVEAARRERDSGMERPPKALVPNIGRYATVYLGFPIWGETTPPLIRGFLSGHDWSGKTLIPFITHGGYGLGDSLAVLRRMAKGAQLGEAFVMQADQERRTMEQVRGWFEARG